MTKPAFFLPGAQTEHAILLVEPDGRTDYKVQQVTPDPDIDYRILVVAPRTSSVDSNGLRELPHRQDGVVRGKTVELTNVLQYCADLVGFDVSADAEKLLVVNRGE